VLNLAYVYQLLGHKAIQGRSRGLKLIEMLSSPPYRKDATNSFLKKLVNVLRIMQNVPALFVVRRQRILNAKSDTGSTAGQCNMNVTFYLRRKNWVSFPAGLLYDSWARGSLVYKPRAGTAIAVSGRNCINCHRILFLVSTLRNRQQGHNTLYAVCYFNYQRDTKLQCRIKLTFM
jgi:hypothetical protein